MLLETADVQPAQAAEKIHDVFMVSVCMNALVHVQRLLKVLACASKIAELHQGATSTADDLGNIDVIWPMPTHVDCPCALIV